MKKQKETGCCPRFDPKPWDKKTIVFKNKLFLKDRVKSFLHMPINFGKIMNKNMPKIEKEKAFPKKFLMLSDENSLWGSDLYIEVTKNIPNSEMKKVSGTFLTKVYEGHYKNMKNWVKDMQEYVKSKNKEIKKMLFYYTTCPKCAKAYGKNYVVIFAQI